MNWNVKSFTYCIALCFVLVSLRFTNWTFAHLRNCYAQKKWRNINLRFYEVFYVKIKLEMKISSLVIAQLQLFIAYIYLGYIFIKITQRYHWTYAMVHGRFILFDNLLQNHRQIKLIDLFFSKIFNEIPTQFISCARVQKKE